MSSRVKRDTARGFWFVLPAVAVIALVTFFPIARTFILSLYKYNLKFPSMKAFVGVNNYINLFQNQDFLNSLTVTVSFTLVAVSIEAVAGLLIALLINKDFKGRGMVRAFTLIPWAIPTVASAQMWRLMYSDQFGVINDIAKKTGIVHEYINIIGRQPQAFWAMVCADAWKTIPFMALLLLAGLQTIPPQLYEAARVDGANKWKQFWAITLPMLKPTLLVALIFRTLDTFKAFDIAISLTNGGPASSTELLSLYNYKVMMNQLNFGMGATISIVIFIFTMSIAFLFIKVLGANPYGK